ncbi:MAG: PAS domain S-box protein [Leptospirillia bacterium]
MGLKRKNSNKDPFSPIRVYLAVLVVIFLVEAAIMLLMPFELDRQDYLIAAALDATLLSVFSAPFLWWIVIRPMRSRAMADRMQAATVLENATEGIIGVGKNGRITTFNAAAEQMFGMAAERAIGQPWQAMVSGPNGPQTSEENSHRPFETTLTRLDGSVFDAEITVSRVAAQGGSSITIYMVRDVTHRKAAEKSLQQHTATLSRAQRIAQVGHWEWDITTGKLDWSDEIYRIFGLDPQAFEATYDAFLTAVHPDDRQYVIDQVNAAIDPKLKQPYAIDHRIIWPSGEVRTVHEQGEVTFDETTGAALHMVGAVHDITDRKDGEATLAHALEEMEDRVRARTLDLEETNRRLTNEVEQHRETEARMSRFRQALDATSDCVFMFEPDTLRFVYVNQGAINQVGYDRETLETMTPLDIKTEYDDGRFRALIAPLISGEMEVRHFETVHRHRNGTETPVEITLQYVSIEDAPLFVSTVRDITERKAAEEKMIAAKETAEYANQAKSEFLSRMSHELRTPLNAMLGFSQLIASDTDDPLTPGQNAHMEEILRAGNHLLDMVNEVLDLTRIESGTLEVFIEPVDVARTVESVLIQFAPMADQYKMSIENHISPTSGCWIQADAARLKEVLNNLVSNAIKYNRPGGTVVLNCEPGPDQTLTISVTDDGPGIPAEQQERLFEPFDRLGWAHSDVEGTGIGLTITKKLVEATGGQILLESHPNRGTRFEVLYPVTGERDTVALDTPVSEVPIATPQAEESPRVVLYIEDNPASVLLMRETFRNRKDIVLLTEPAGQPGLNTAHEAQPNLILLDINLPDMEGYDVLAELRSASDTHHIPVFGISANSFPEDIERARQAGFDEYITKPFNLATLLSHVDEVLNAS